MQDLDLQSLLRYSIQYSRIMNLPSVFNLPKVPQLNIEPVHSKSFHPNGALLFTYCACIWFQNGRASLGDLIYRYISSEQFSPECLLDCIDLSSEHQALEIANRVEASIYIWRRRANPKPLNSTSRSNSKSSWALVKELVIDVDKRELLADRAESLLLCLRQRFPGLTQTTLDMSKIQCNKV